MVSLEIDNVYQLREYLYLKVCKDAFIDPFKSSFLYFLKLSENLPIFDFTSLSLYQRCTISGLQIQSETISSQDILRLLGQAPKIDSTPRPWVSDIFGVLAIKWLVEKNWETNIDYEFNNWISGFLERQIDGDHFNLFEKDIAMFVRDGKSASFSSACVPLFFHYQKILRIEDHKTRLSLISNFLNEFKTLAHGETSTALLSLLIYVFDKINQDVAVVAPNGWSFNDLIKFLENIPVGLKRWTWEETGRTKGAESVKWSVENEYHVQNLLYVLLAPIFNDIADEVTLQPVGQKNPRIDLYLPALHTIIEVKYRKDTKKSFQMLIGEIAEDASLYHVDTKYNDAHIICFLWDRTRATQDHSKFKEGILKIKGIDGCVVINAPSTMD
ncbi:hypothetical protein [Acinetobacter radioresistens]|uniref:PD-(D/E)XK nuclease domain-containing protein n=1 Tax=Acinetobacter radioresistens TaxID=40216 RepID=UPI002006998D|nr:hypothetical protein [Acinetobacter radioresistens]MCK4101518.1 hypothetical protein [Acinetobacter radioresistens]